MHFSFVINCGKSVLVQKNVDEWSHVQGKRRDSKHRMHNKNQPKRICNTAALLDINFTSLATEYPFHYKKGSRQTFVNRVMNKMNKE